MYDFGAKFSSGQTYNAFLEQYGTEEHRRRWREMFDQIQLSDRQTELLKSFVREMKVLVLAGAWCGDCVNQCPIFAHFERVSPLIQVRYFDRDADAELAAEMSVCGAARVPSVVFLSEDNFFCGQYGDRTISKYRQMVSSMAGAACPTGLVAPEKSLLDGVVEDWLAEFERIQWMLRTSGRLRQKHQD